MVNEQLDWFECIGGWFGVERKHYKMAYEVIASINRDRDPDIKNRTSTKLIEMMNWAEGRIPYEISTVHPENVCVGTMAPDQRQAELNAAYHMMQNGFKTNQDPEPDELNRRADMIAECQAKLDHMPLNADGTTYLEKMENTEFYSLVRNIGKYIVEQNRLRLESLKAGE